MSDAPTQPATLEAGGSRLPDVQGLPDGAREVSPLLVMLVGIAIPVALVAVACSGGSTAVLVLAVIAMIAVGTITMVFMGLLTDDPENQHDAPGDSRG